MSPFAAVADRVTARIRQLSLRQQVALFVCAAEVLVPGYQRWRTAAAATTADDTDDQTSLFDGSVLQAKAYAVDGTRPDAELLDNIVSATPTEPTDLPAFTTAQDCWICLDTAIRAIVELYDAADSAWYLFEPIFQSTSQRLFGYDDVGSEHEDAAESRALADPALGAALAAVDKAIDVAARGLPTSASLAEMRLALGPLSPI